MMNAIKMLFLIATTSTASIGYANSLVPVGPRPAIGKSRLSAVPTSEWNKLSLSYGKNVEIWTIDGDALNKVTFFSGIPVGAPLMREIDKKNRPLPRVTGNMLITDIPGLLEASYRVQFSTNRMTIDSQEPAILGGQKAIRFTYSYTSADEVLRRGEAVGTFLDKSLYLIAYEAPALYFFDKDLEKFRSLAATFKL